MKIFKFLFIFLFLSVFSIPGYAQSDLKKYSGPYPGLPISNRDGGEATYTYIPNPEGGRIFQGPFEYWWDQYHHQYIKGNFDNNKQTGEWIAKVNEWEVIQIMVTFKDGVLDGPVKIVKGNPDSESFVFFNSILTNGVLNGPFQIARNNYNQFLRMEGEMVNNIPTGTAYITNDYTEKAITIKHDLDNSQVIITEIQEDPRTGDVSKENNTFKYNGSVIISVFNYIIGFDIEEINSLLSDMVFRDSQPYESTILEPVYPSIQNDKNAVQNSQLKSNQQSDEQESESDQPYEKVEEPAEFPGGQAALMRFLANNIRYPEAAAQNDIQGRVVVNFIIEKDGSISNPKVLKSVDPDLDREAIRVVSKMPRWTPGKNNGVPVRSYFNFPVTFKLQNN